MSRSPRNTVRNVAGACMVSTPGVPAKCCTPPTVQATRISAMLGMPERCICRLTLPKFSSNTRGPLRVLRNSAAPPPARAFKRVHVVVCKIKMKKKNMGE